MRSTPIYHKEDLLGWAGMEGRIYEKFGLTWPETGGHNVTLAIL